MNPSGIWAKRLAWSLLALIAIAAILWTISRALYPTGAQRDALAAMQLPAPPPGRNAFAALWTLDRAVPPEELPRIIELDAARISGMLRFPDPDDAETSGFVSADDRYPDLSPSPEDRRLFCSSTTDDCLGKVSGDIATYRALVERNRRLLDRIEALAEYDFVRQQLPWHMSASVVTPGHGGLSATRHALWFAEGRVDDALAASCRGIDTWRRLGASADTLTVRMVANAYAARNHGELLAEMLARLPLDHPLPPACTRALAPPPARELSLCTAMQGEFEMISEFTGPVLERSNSRNWWSSLVFFLTYDHEATMAIHARNLAPICTEHELERILADRAEIDPPEAPEILRFACLGNSMGCLLSSIATPNYASYRIRMQDFGARIELLATLAWLRENADRPEPLDAILDQRPEALKRPTRQAGIGEEGDSLNIPMFGDPYADTWSIPLPAGLRQ